MDSIVRLLKDPSWWFTAVFIGIIASLIASYFRDAISSVAGRVSGVWRARREARLARERRRIDLLVAHPYLLIMEMVRVAIGMVVFLGSFVFYVSLPSFIDVMSKTPEFTRLDFFSPDISRKFGLLLVPLAGVTAMLAGFRATSSLRVSLQAWREYEVTCKRAQVVLESPSPNKALQATAAKPSS